MATWIAEAVVWAMLFLLGLSFGLVLGQLLHYLETRNA